MSEAEEEGSSFLEAEIRSFREHRETMRQLLDETQQLVADSFAKKLSPEFSSCLQDSLQLAEVRRQVDGLFRGHAQPGSSGSSRPCIVIAGQTKSGKSSFINELLGGTFVAQSQSPCTARVTRLTYSANMYVRVLDKSGRQIGDVTHLTKPTIDEDLVKLKDEERENEELISSTIEAGVSCDFLKNGVDIVDSPGLNENSSLDSLTMGAINSFLPIIIYVIDSNSGITVAVQKDLGAIKNAAAGAEVFYLITKMDVSKETASEAGRQVEDIEEEKEERVFAKLQQLGYLPQEAARGNCRNFLCVSCWETRRHRRRQEAARRRQAKNPSASAQPEAEKPKWVARFDETKSRILEFARSQFKNLVCGAGCGLKGVHCRVLTMFMDKAQDIKRSNLRKQLALEQIKNLELEIHRQSKTIVDSQRELFLEEVAKFFRDQAPKIREDVRVLQYSSDVINEDMSASEIEKKCIQEIHAFIHERIVVTFSEFLRDGVLKTCFEEFEQLKEKVKEYEKDVDRTPAYQVLKQTLLDGYELSSRHFISSTFASFFHKIRKMVSLFFKSPGLVFTRPVQDAEWKDIQAESYLRTINKTKLVDCLISSLKDWFNARHDEFLEKIRSSEQLVETGMRLTDKERTDIKSLYPKVARLHMRTLDVVTKYQLREHRLDPEQHLGSGAQGEVFLVSDASGQAALAAKRLVADDKTLDDIATEVYHSSILEHENLVKVIGVRLQEMKPNKQKWTVELYMELMSSDVWTLMQQRTVPLRKRVWIGLQLAKALQFLHNNELVHRDIKLANVLVNDSLDVVKLSDFGLLKCTGFVGHTLVGTPIYLAPELVRGDNCSTAADIFSLGIALWYLVEGSGKKHPDYVEIMPSVGAILLAGALDCRPNRPAEAPEALWALMTKCWDGAPDKRPDIGEAIRELESLLNDMGPD